MGPAPPKAISVKSRGSWPRWIEISRMAEVMRATAIVTMPSASASTPSAGHAPGQRRHRRARLAGIEGDAAAEAPAAPMRPSTTLASVTVGSVPPRP